MLVGAGVLDVAGLGWLLMIGSSGDPGGSLEVLETASSARVRRLRAPPSAPGVAGTCRIEEVPCGSGVVV